LEVSANVKIEKKFKLWESQYVESAEGKVCFAVSMPTKMTPSNLNPSGEPNFVTFRPKDGVSNEISVTSGYPFKKQSNVNVKYR
jgi:hypothetical protein